MVVVGLVAASNIIRLHAGCLHTVSTRGEARVFGYGRAHFRNLDLRGC